MDREQGRIDLSHYVSSPTTSWGVLTTYYYMRPELFTFFSLCFLPGHSGSTQNWPKKQACLAGSNSLSPKSLFNPLQCLFAMPKIGSQNQMPLHLEVQMRPSLLSDALSVLSQIRMCRVAGLVGTTSGRQAHSVQSAVDRLRSLIQPVL